MAEILNKFPLVYVNSINSIGNGLYIDSDKEEVVIKPKGGFGGLGGEYVKPTALANVRAFAQRLKPEIKIIGTGGITCGKDVLSIFMWCDISTSWHTIAPRRSTSF